MITVTCPHCHTSMQVPESFAGQSGPCRTCQQTLQVPSATASSPGSYMRAVSQSSSGSFPSHPPSYHRPPSHLSGAFANSMSSGESGFESLKIDLNVQHLEKLGEGGMGVVLRVNDRRLNRDAALKILKSDVSNEEMERRFLREAKITAQLDHPSIPPVYEIGHTSGGDLFLLMRVIEGETLQKKIRRYHDEDKNPKALRELLDGLLKVSQAVAYAHSQNIVHRDLKPQNIMVGQFGEVMVMDWGLGKDLSNQESDDFLDDKTKNLTEIEEGEGLTQVGAVMGTLGYMPPEQAGGEAIDQRADIFALGAILTEILTREVPIAGKTNTNKMVATIKGEIRTPRDLDSTVPGELNAIATEALAADVDDRMGETNEFTENLSAYLAGREVPVYNYSAAEKVTRQAQKRPGLLLGLPIVLTLLMVTVVLGIQLSTADEQRAIAEETAEQKSKDLKEKESELSETRVEAEETKVALKKKKEALKKNKEDLKKNKEALERNKNELKTKEKIDQLLTEAEREAERGQSLWKIGTKVKEALELSKRQYDDLLRAADIYRAAKAIDLAKLHLEEASRAKAPHQALFRLHVLEVEERKNLALSSEYLEQLQTLRASGEKDKIYVLFAKAHKSLRDGQNDSAIQRCTEILKENKRFAIVYFLRGLASVNRGDITTAMSDFKAVLKLKPLASSAYYWRGICSKVTADRIMKGARSRGMTKELAEQEIDRCFKEAKADFSRCLDINPRHSRAYFGRAEITYRTTEGTTRDLEEVRKQLDKAIQIDRKLISAYRFRGKINEYLDDNEAAIRDYKKVIELNPNDYGAYYDLGDPYKQLGRDYEAYKCYEMSYKIKSSFFNGRYYKIKADHESKGAIPRISDEKKLKELNAALEMREDNGKLRSYRAKLYVSLGRFRDALKDYDILTRSKKPKAEYSFEMAKIFLTLGEKNAAEKAAKQAAKRSSKYKDRWKKELRERAKFQERQKTIDKLRKKLKGSKKDSKTLRKIAKEQDSQRRRRDAIKTLQAAVKLDPTSSDNHLALGKLQREEKCFDESIASLTSAIQHSKQAKEAYMKRAEAYRSLKKFEKALLDFGQAIKNGYKVEEARRKRAEVNFDLRNYKAALDDLNTLIQAKPDDKDAIKLRAKVYWKTLDERCLADFRRALELKEDWKLERDYGYALFELSEYRSAARVLKQVREKYKKKFSGRDESNTKRLYLSAKSRLRKYQPK